MNKFISLIRLMSGKAEMKKILSKSNNIYYQFKMNNNKEGTYIVPKDRKYSTPIQTSPSF